MYSALMIKLKKKILAVEIADRSVRDDQNNSRYIGIKLI